MGLQKLKTNQSASWFGMTKKNNVQKNKNTLNIYTICWSNTVVNMETSCVVVPRHASFFFVYQSKFFYTNVNGWTAFNIHVLKNGNCTTHIYITSWYNKKKLKFTMYKVHTLYTIVHELHLRNVILIC